MPNLPRSPECDTNRFTEVRRLERVHVTRMGWWVKPPVVPRPARAVLDRDLWVGRLCGKPINPLLRNRLARRCTTHSQDLRRRSRPAAGRAPALQSEGRRLRPRARPGAPTRCCVVSWVGPLPQHYCIEAATHDVLLVGIRIRRLATAHRSSSAAVSPSTTRRITAMRTIRGASTSSSVGVAQRVRPSLAAASAGIPPSRKPSRW
jgi:hypothetical protein